MVLMRGHRRGRVRLLVGCGARGAVEILFAGAIDKLGAQMSSAREMLDAQAGDF